MISFADDRCAQLDVAFEWAGMTDVGAVTSGPPAEGSTRWLHSEGALLFGECLPPHVLRHETRTSVVPGFPDTESSWPAELEGRARTATRSRRIEDQPTTDDQSSGASDADLVTTMTRSGLRTMLVDVMRAELPARRNKSAGAQHASETVEVSEMDRAAARTIARRMGFHVREGKR